jgi:hypothetical protein
LGGEHVNVGALTIGGQIPFELPPEMVHRVEFRTLARQPEQRDVQLGGQGQAASGGMAARFALAKARSAGQHGNG